MGMVRPIAAMGVEDRDGASPQRFAPDLTREIIQALPPAAPERTSYDRRVPIERRAEHRRDRQEDGPIDAPLMEGLTHLVDPVVDIDFGAPQAPRRFTTHRHQVLPRAAVQAAVCTVPHRFWVATCQHLGYQTIVVGRLITWRDTLKRVPVIGKDRLEDPPVPSGWWHHRIAPSRGNPSVAVQRLCHASAASSTPHRPLLRDSHPPRSPWNHGDFRQPKNAFSYTINIADTDMFNLKE